MGEEEEAAEAVGEFRRGFFYLFLFSPQQPGCDVRD